MRTLALCAVLAALAVIAVPAAIAHKDPGGPVVGGLFNPRGIDIGPSGRLFVAESGSGEITRIRTWGRNAPNVSTFATLPTLPGGPEDDPPALGPVEVAVSHSGKKYVLMSGPPRGDTDEFARLIQVRRNGSTRLIAAMGPTRKAIPTRMTRPFRLSRKSRTRTGSRCSTAASSWSPTPPTTTCC